MLAPPFTTVGSSKLGFHPGNTRIGCVDKQEDTAAADWAVKHRRYIMRLV